MDGIAAGNARCHVNNELCVPRFGGTPKSGKWAGVGFCAFHYSRAYKERDNLFSLDYGKGKYQRESRRTDELCPVPGCTEYQMPVRGLCPKHHKFAWRYRVTDEAMLEMLTNPVCANPGCTNTGKLVMDHDHSCCEKAPTCGECNRSWLCVPCNIALGMIQDNPLRLRGLIEYLERYN